jgi:hypothetical protein
LRVLKRMLRSLMSSSMGCRSGVIGCVGAMEASCGSDHRNPAIHGTTLGHRRRQSVSTYARLIRVFSPASAMGVPSIQFGPAGGG